MQFERIEDFMRAFAGSIATIAMAAALCIPMPVAHATQAQATATSPVNVSMSDCFSQGHYVRTTEVFTGLFNGWQHTNAEGYVWHGGGFVFSVVRTKYETVLSGTVYYGFKTVTPAWKYVPWRGQRLPAYVWLRAPNGREYRQVFLCTGLGLHDSRYPDPPLPK